MYRILKYPHPALRKKAKPVKKIGEEELMLVRDMINLMLSNDGVGLAANQVGVLKQVFVASPNMRRDEVLVLFNPKIIRRRGKLISEEGCLSLPGINIKIKRAESIEVCGLDLEGKEIRIKANGLLARIIQHEIDHINGKLILDYLPYRVRRKYYKEFKGRCE